MGTTTEKLNKIVSTKDSIRSAIINKGVSVPTATTLSQYSSKIDSIQTGPVEAIEKDVNFYDYDGFRVASYTITEAKELTSLPTPPTHEGLTFQGWNWTLSQLQNYNRKFANIGANYMPANGNTVIKIKINNFKEESFAISLRLSGNTSVLISYGDGRSETQSNTGSSATNYSISHSYTSNGDYSITFSPSGLNGKFGFANTTSNYYRYYIIKEINIGNNVLLDQSYALAYLNCKLSLPSTGLSITGTYCFGYSSIPQVNIPPTVTASTGYMFYYFKGEVSFPPTISTLTATYLFTYANINSVVLPKPSSNASVGNTLLSNTYNMTVLSLPSNFTFNTASNIFTNCKKITFLDVESGWTPTQNITFSTSTCYPAHSMVTFFTNLGTTSTTRTLTFGSTNLNRLTAIQKAIATDKGYTLS